MTSIERLIALALQLAPDRLEAVGDLMVAAMAMLLADLPRNEAIETFRSYAASVVDAAVAGG